jgi:predicted lipoprotein with Yx(FWY)xxD motif
MKASLLSIGTLVTVAALAVGLNNALAANHTARHGPTTAPRGVVVAVANSSLGRILVDGHGRTLYLFGKDEHGKSACSGQCASFWPPLITARRARAKAGAKASLLGTTRRADGRLQVTYNHHPVYRFAKDTKKGQTNGEGLNIFGGTWYAVSSKGSKIKAANGGGGYGY